MSIDQSAVEVDIISLVSEILTSSGKPAPDDVGPTSSLRRDFGLESLDLAELTVVIEDKYQVDVFADGLVDSVREIAVKLVSRK